MKYYSKNALTRIVFHILIIFLTVNCEQGADLRNTSNSQETLEILIQHGHKAQLSSYSSAFAIMNAKPPPKLRKVSLPDLLHVPKKTLLLLYRFEFQVSKKTIRPHTLEITGRIHGAHIYLNNKLIKEYTKTNQATKQLLVLPKTQVLIPHDRLKRINTLWIILHNQHYLRPSLDSITLHQRSEFAIKKMIGGLIGLVCGSFLIAIVFNLTFYFLNHNSVHIYSGLIPLILLAHSLLFLPEIFAGHLILDFWSYLHGFDVSIIMILTPMFLFLFYSRMFPYASKENINFGLFKKAGTLLFLIQRHYITKVGLGLSFYLILTKQPIVYQELLKFLFWMYTIPVSIFTIILLSLAFRKRRLAVIFSILAGSFLLLGVINDSWVILQYEYPILGLTPIMGFLFMLSYIIMLVLNRFRTMRDVHKTRQILNDSNKKLRQKDELKNNYILASTHELTEPLEKISNIIVSTIDKSSSKIPSDVLSHFSQILDIARRLQQRYSRVELYFNSLNQDTQNITNIQIKELLDYFYLLIERDHGHIRLKISIESTLKVRADRDLLLVYLMELFDNSCLYNTVPEIRIRLFQRGDEMILSYHDQGLETLSEQILEYFGAFQRGAVSKSRIGLGLSLVFRIAELHGYVPEVSSKGEILLRLKSIQTLNLNENTSIAIKHIVLLYKNRMYRQACNEIGKFKGYKLRRLFLYLFASADIVNRFLNEYNEKK